MIIFIFGEDIYQSEMRLLELKSKFKEKYGEINFSLFSVGKKEEANTSKMISEIDSVPFLGAKRLIIIYDLVINGDLKAKEKISRKLKHIPESSIVIFFEREAPRKNDKLFKELKSSARVEEFPQIRGPKLLNWIKKETALRGGKIEDKAAERLVILIGEDSLRLSNEIEKLINYAHPRAIRQEEVELLVAEKIKTKIFDLVDNLAYRNGREVIRSLHRLIDLGEEEIYLLSMITYGFRNLILVKYLNEVKKNIKETEIMKILGLHPFVFRKTLSASKSFSFLELKKIYHRLVSANLEMRETNKDPILVLDFLVSEICVR